MGGGGVTASIYKKCITAILLDNIHRKKIQKRIL